MLCIGEALTQPQATSTECIDHGGKMTMILQLIAKTSMVLHYNII